MSSRIGRNFSELLVDSIVKCVCKHVHTKYDQGFHWSHNLLTVHMVIPRHHWQCKFFWCLSTYYKHKCYWFPIVHIQKAMAWLSTLRVTSKELWRHMHKTNWVFEETPLPSLCSVEKGGGGGCVFLGSLWYSCWPLLSVCAQPGLALIAFLLLSSKVDLNIVKPWLKMKSLLVVLDKREKKFPNVV